MTSPYYGIRGAIRDSILEKIQSVLLKVTIDKVIITEVKQKRNRISPDITERPAFLKRMDFNASTAYASGFTLAKYFSQPGKLAIGYTAPLGKKSMTFRKPLRMPTILGWPTLPRMTNMRLSRQSVVRMMIIKMDAH
jgi:hypothetical protein